MGMDRAPLGHPAGSSDQGAAPGRHHHLPGGGQRLPAGLFIQRYNARFAKAPQDPNSAWVPLPAEMDLAYYFAVRESRKVRADHCISFSGQLLQLVPDPKGPSLVDESVTVHIVPEGDIYPYHDRHPVAYRPVPAPEAVPPKPIRKGVRQPKPTDPKAAARRRGWLFARG